MKTKFYLIIFSFIFSFMLLSCDDDTNNNNNNNTDIIDDTTDDATDINNDTDDGGDATDLPVCSAPHRDFWNYDLSHMPPSNVQIPATCYGESEHAYVYVADEAWGISVTQEMVDKILNTWEVGTDKYPDRGVYPTDTAIFGDPPDVDGDPHIIIFITPLGSFNGTTFDGYFKSDNEVAGASSNMTEMIYIDCGNHEPDSDYLLGVLAHEFQHMLQWNIDPYEDDWLDETFSQAAMVETGYWSDLPYANTYLAHSTTTQTLPVDDVRNYNYGAGFIFASYAIDRFGTDFFHDIATNATEKGIASINSALITYATDSNYNFFDLILDWAIASLLNDQNVEDGRYVYNTLGSEVIPPNPSVAQSGSPINVNIAVAGYYYAAFNDLSSSQTVNITLSTDDNTYIKSKVVFNPSDGSTPSVSDIDLSSGTATFTTPSAGSLVLVVERIAGSGNVSLTFN